MKIILYLLFISCSVTGFGQHTSFDSAWKKNFYRNFTPETLINDTCYNSYCLLKINLDRKSNVTSISLSDNADSVIKKSIANMIEEKIFGEYLLSNGARKKKIKNTSLIYPLIIVTNDANCPDQKGNSVVDEKLFLFNKHYLSGSCMFREPIMLITYPPVTKISYNL